jgi:hypothetical protein
MAKAAEPKKKAPSKVRATKYDEKLQVNTAFEELANALVTPKPPTKKK